MNARLAARLAACLICAVAVACGGGDEPAAPPADADAGTESVAAADETPPSAGDDEQADPGSLAPLTRFRITVYFPSNRHYALVPETREIFDTASPVDRAKQILADLISGPSKKIAALSALPPGTRIRQVYVLDDGTAWVDFSPELRDGIGGGTHNELLTAYAVVNSLALNVPEIRRVGILIEGRITETLGGHLDLRRPLPANTSYIRGSSISVTVEHRPSSFSIRSERDTVRTHS